MDAVAPLCRPLKRAPKMGGAFRDPRLKPGVQGGSPQTESPLQRATEAALMIRRLIVPDRGEIAVRIARAYRAGATVLAQGEIVERSVAPGFSRGLKGAVLKPRARFSGRQRPRA